MYVVLLSANAFSENLYELKYEKGKKLTVPTPFFNEYTTLEIAAGFNADLIASGTGSLMTSVTHDTDGYGYCLISQGLQINNGDTPITYGLPEDGYIGNMNSGPDYQLSSYTANNALRLFSVGEVGTLTFSNPIALEKVYFLVTSGLPSDVSGTLNFTDGSTQIINAATIPGWFSESWLPVVITGLGRGNIATDQLDAFDNAPNLFQLEITILEENQTKALESVTINKDNDGSVFSLLGASGKLVSSTITESQAFQIVSGFNADIIANGFGPLSGSVTHDADGYDYSLIAEGLQVSGSDDPITFGLPVDGFINNATGEPNFQLSSYDQNNALRLFAIGDVGTVVFANPMAMEKVYLLVTSGLPSDISGSLNFTDGTTQSITTAVIPGWFSESGLPIVITGIGRGNITTNQLDIFGNAPNLFQLEVTVSDANQAKQIQSVTINKENDGSVFNLMGVSGAYTVLATNHITSSTISVYPNPVKDFVFIKSRTPVQELAIYTSTGKLIHRKTNNTAQVNVSDLAKGVYYIKVINGNYDSQTFRIMKL